MSIENKITGGILEGWELIAEIDVAVDSDYVEVSNINGDKDTIYLIAVSLICPTTTTASHLHIVPNGLGPVGSFQRVYGVGTSINAVRVSGYWKIGDYYPGKENFTVARVYAKSGVFRRLTSFDNHVDGNGNLNCSLFGSIWDDSSTIITSLRVAGATTGAIGAGSKVFFFKLMKHKAKGIKKSWEKIADIEVASDSTSVSISGLTGDSDQIYRLGSLIKNPTATGARYELRPNGDPIGTSQKIYAEGTTRSAESNAFFQIQENRAGEESLSHTIIFAKSGVQRKFVTHLSSGALFMMLWSNLWDNSTSVITSLEIVSNQTGGIGAGSRFILYRLRS